MVQFNLLRIVLASIIYGVMTNAQSFDDIIASDSNLTLLNTALGASTFNLSDAYNTSVTLFAPNNDAFTSNASAALLTKYAGKQYIAHLQNLLLMHVYAEAEVFSNNLTDGQVVTAANNETITVTIGTTGTVTLLTADSNATVVAPDIVSSDGVLHQIDGVLLPSFVSTSLIDLTTDVDGFDIVLELLTSTGLAKLVGPGLTATVFAPTDKAFGELPEGALDYYKTNSGVATILLSGHVVSPLIIPTQNMVNGSSYATPGKTNLTITIEENEGDMVYYVNSAKISAPNTLANNGIIHAIDTVLVVPGAEYPPKITAPTSPTATPPTAPTPSSSAMTMTYFMASITSVFGILMMV